MEKDETKKTTVEETHKPGQAGRDETTTTHQPGKPSQDEKKINVEKR